MFDRVSDAAEKLATSVSRRAFMGGLGKGVLGLAALIGGVFAFAAQAQAGNTDLCCRCGGRQWKITKNRPCDTSYCAIVYCRYK